jgi:HAMP domain-containing protein
MQVTLVLTVIAGVALVLAALAFAWVFALARRVRALASARGDLARMAAAGDFQGVAQALSARIDETSVRYVGLHRFDALPGDVGEQSFVVALLDERATGFVLTSMYGRGAYRLYAKPIVSGLSELVLTEEEALAARRALDGTGMQVTGQERARRAGS